MTSKLKGIFKDLISKLNYYKSEARKKDLTIERLQKENTVLREMLDVIADVKITK